MTDFKPSEPMEIRRRDEFFELGGLRFVVSSNDYGANLALFGDLGKGSVELIRFQDYVDDPHYHAPIGGWYAFDRAKLGEPLHWWITQLRDNLRPLLEESGFGAMSASIDFDAVSANVEQLRAAMIECVPPNYTRVPGIGIRRTDWSTDESAFQKRNVSLIDIGGLRFEIFFDRDMGATMEVFALTDNGPVGMIRLDDYDENPHYHAPVGTWYGFDRAVLGEPLAWFIDQVRNHLHTLFETSRLTQIVPHVDFALISANADLLYDAMAARVPRGCVRIPGIGLQRTTATSGKAAQ